MLQMSDLYELIPSKDIREHLKKINYQFEFGTALDLIQWQFYVGVPITEKHRILKEFKSMFKNENTSYDRAIEGMHIDTTTHDVVDRIINREEFSIKNFQYNYNNEYVYYYKFLKKKVFEGMSEGEKCDSYENCIDNIKKEIENKKANNEMSSFDNIKITRDIKDGRHPESEMILNKDLEIIHISYTGNTDEDWSREKYESLLTYDYFGEAPCVPVPFKDGELVCTVDEPENVMMLITGANKDEAKMYDCDELSIDEDGKFEWRPYDPFENGWTNDWIELEYFRGDVEKNKQKIDSLKKEAERVK